jgi:PAS domain S-box-containing protein
VIDPDGNFLFANNNAAYNLSGRTPEDVVGKNIREFVSQEQAEALKEKYRSVVISGEPLVQDVRISLKHRERWFHNNLKPIVFGPTRIPAVLSISLDITDRKQAEAALQEAGATLKFALRSARAGTWDWDFSSGKLTWSPEFYLLFNLPADSPPTFETWLMTLHPDDRKQAMDKIDQSVKEHLNLWNEYRIVLTDGSLRWIGAAGSTSYNDNGEPLRMSGICIDITGRKQAERALLESERKYRHIFTHAPLGFMQYDMEGTIVDCNEKFSEIIGAPKERLIGFNMLRGMKDGPARTALVNALETGTGYYEGPYHSVTGDKDVMMRALHQRLTDNSGATIGAISIFEDISERKTAEEALAENERKLNFVMDGVPALLAYIDADMRYVYVNKAYADWYGMTRDEITGKKIPDLLTKDVFERSLPNYQKVLSGIPVSYENRTTDRAGKERYVSVRLIPNFHNENVTGWFASIIDITDRKAVEEALRVSEERLRSTFASMDDLVFNLDENGIFTGSYNPVMENLYTSPEQFLGKPFRDVLPKELSDQIQKAITEIKNTGDTLQIEYSLPLHGDTAWFNASLSPCFSPEGAFSGVTIVARNITDHKRDEMALRESEQRHRLLADNASDVIWIMDPSGQFTYVSPSIGRLRGYTPEEVRHQSIDQQFTPASAAVAHRVLAEAFDEVRAGRRYLGFRGELEQPCKDGSTVWTEITTSGIYNEANEFVGVLGVGRDITKRRLVEEGLRQANKKLSLLSGITRHDINNQLTVLQGYLRLLEKKQDDPYKVERLQKAAAAAQNIASMIQFTKEYESIGIEAPIWQNCRTLVDSATQEIQLGKVIVRNDLLKDAEIFADPLIVKVFYNLMDNAMRYGERITLIRFFSREQENQHIIVCEDDGVGIPTEDKSKIFERGFGKNTGLGLYLAREILSMTGITIQETGTPGNGARFEITIPGEEYRISGTWPNHSIVHNNTLTTGDNH